MKDLRNYSLKQHNTFGIDAKCSRFVEFAHEDEVVKFVKDGEICAIMNITIAYLGSDMRPKAIPESILKMFE